MAGHRPTPIAIAVVVVAVVGVLTGPERAAAQEDPVERVAGGDRFATAAELAGRVDGDTLWVATGFDFADALAAGATGTGPVLLVAGDTAPQSTLDAASELEDIQRVRAVGGPSALGDEAVDAVADAADVTDVERLSGPQRFATAAAVSEQAHPDGAKVAYVATGLAFPDALTASAAAAENDAPVLLTTRDTVPHATREELTRLDVAEVVIVGGEAAVGPAVEAELGELAGEVTRVAGTSRYATATEVSRHRDLAPGGQAFLATGQDFPDVLAAAPAASNANAPLLLTPRYALPISSRDELHRLGPSQATVAGGEQAISKWVADEVRRALDDDVPGEVSVHFFDVGQADSTLVATEYVSILVDAGHSQGDGVVDHLADAGVTDKLDVLALTHWGPDHIGQVPDVLDAVDVDEVWIQPGEADSAAYDEAMAAIEASDATVRQPEQGDHYPLTTYLGVDVIGPSDAANTDDHHDANLSLRVRFDHARVLFTGDAESETEQRYVDAVPGRLDAQLYQVGNHGSRTATSQALLDAATPDHAVYSAGADNTDGHPHSDTLDRLDAAGVDVYGTDVNGTVTATSNGSIGWSITTERDGTPAPGD